MDSYGRDNIILNKEYKHLDHPKCDCEADAGVTSCLMTSYALASIGRRYYACGNIFEGLDCGFHQWYDHCEIVSPYIVNVVETLNVAYNRAECENMILSDENMKLKQRIKLLEESTQRLSNKFEKLNESYRRSECEILELSTEMSTQRQLVEQLKEEKNKIIEDVAKIEFKVTIERISH
ncbi:hypothetical protein ACFE04_028837 [Oxalis oulophora]